MERIIIINWRFEEPEFVEVEVSESEGDKLFCSNCTDPGDFYDLIKNLESTQVLILLHENEPNAKVTLGAIKTLKCSSQIKKFAFSGGEQPVYNSQGGLLDSVNQIIDTDCWIDEGKKIIKRECFNNVWDEYWIRRDLDYQKRKIIKLLLPLTIDIQGLSEINDDNKKEEYLKKIKQEYLKNDFCKNIRIEWEEIKKVVLPTIDDKNNKVDFPPFNKLLEENTEDTGTILRNFIEDNVKIYRENPVNHEALPIWLQDIVNMLDRKINADL